MAIPKLQHCPGTLATGYQTYSRTCLKRVFNGRKVHHVLKYDSPAMNAEMRELFDEHRKQISISGVQEKFSILLDKNQIRLAQEGERGTHILKPIPQVGKRADQMPANEHVTMQIARQVYKINTAENALIFFQDGSPAYLTKRFDTTDTGEKRAQEDFAALAQRTPHTHGEHYKYTGNYLELFDWMKAYLPAYQPEAVKLFKQLIFNYLFSNGDAHLKNFSLLETPMGDSMLSPAYDLLNSRIHVEDADFALEEGLLPKRINQGKISQKFRMLAEQAGIKTKISERILAFMLKQSEAVQTLVTASFLDPKTKRSYLQQYQTRVKKLARG
ncbi:MAG: HipA domain-containing protein [Bacteroidota bacterium]